MTTPESTASRAGSQAFVEFPGLLIVRLMSRCNQRCLFCMVDDEVAAADEVPFAEVIARIDAQVAPARIDFFGGEPTLHPDFLRLLRYAAERGHRCSLASNGRIFASQAFTAQVAACGADDLYVRTSLYGDTPQLHDYYAASLGSHAQTLAGIRNMVAAGFRVQVNIVLLRENISRLREMTALVHRLGAPAIKYGGLVDVATCAEHTASLQALKPRLLDAIAFAEALGLGVTVEKTPVCAVGGRLDLLSTERLLGDWPRAFDDEGACSGCLLRRWCEGLDPEYAALFGMGGLERITAVSPRVLRPLSGDPEPETLKFACVVIPDEAISGDTLSPAALEALGALGERVQANFGRLVVFSPEHIQGAD